jgi:hypothetical protein
MKVFADLTVIQSFVMVLLATMDIAVNQDAVASSLPKRKTSVFLL